MGDLEPFRPRFPWINGDLQTVRNFFYGEEYLQSEDARIIDLNDGTGDQLRVSLDWPEGRSDRLPVLLIHGLTGCEGSTYMLSAMAHFRAEGRVVIRMNQRGAGPGAAIAGQHYHGGRSRDIDAVVKALPEDLTANGIIAAGFSLGGNTLLKYQGEEGEASKIKAAISVSSPIHLALTSARISAQRNFIYHYYLIKRMQTEVLHENAMMTDQQRAAALSAKTIYDFDDNVTAPRAGFSNADAFYESNMARRFLPTIRHPALMIHAMDDPWIPIEAYEGNPQEGNDMVQLELVRGGGHVGFHRHGTLVPWHLPRISRFLAEHGL